MGELSAVLWVEEILTMQEWDLGESVSTIHLSGEWNDKDRAQTPYRVASPEACSRGELALIIT